MSTGRRALVRELARAAVEAVDAELVTARALEELARDGTLHRNGGRVVVFAFGKAARPMAQAVAATGVATEGIVVGLAGGAIGSFDVRVGAHPLPAPDASETGHAVLALARSLRREDVALCLVSGGGSSMLEVPAEGLALGEVAEAARTLMEGGVDIEGLNAVRSALSDIKGGKLAAAMGDARIVNLVVSDVPGYPSETVASGPTMASASTVDARAVIASLGLEDVLGPRVIAAVEGASQRRAPIASGRITTRIVADNEMAQRGVVARAMALGLAAQYWPEPWRGEASKLGLRLAATAAAELSSSQVDLVVSGGESTVSLGSTTIGRGGRCHELALGAMNAVGAHLLAAFGTDGVDATSGAAGAFVDADLAREASARGLSAQAALEAHASGDFFSALGAQISLGDTKTNVADIAIVLR